MSQKDLSYFINKDEMIIRCKKRAKQLLKESKNSIRLQLTQCQDIAAKELGYKDWFDLHQFMKTKYKPILKSFINQSLWNNLLDDAIADQVTDLHFSIRKEHCYISRRINTKLISYPHHFTNDTIIKTCIDLHCLFYPDTPFDSKKFNHGAVKYKNDVFLVYQTLPTYPDGFDFVIQIRHHQNIHSLQQLGYTLQQIIQIYDNFQEGRSLVIGGLCGNGTTTTLRSILSQKHSNPVVNNRYIIDNNEIHLPSVKKISYENAIQCLNESPLPLMIVDGNSKQEPYNIELFIKHGIQTLITMHAASAIGMIYRLLETNSFSSNHFKSFVYQRLIPVVCPHCSHYLTGENLSNKHQIILSKLQNLYPQSYLDNIKVSNYSGCKLCKHTGFIAQTACSESIEIDSTIEQFIKDGKIQELLHYWRTLSDNNPLSENMFGKSIKEHAILKMFQGLVDPLTIESYFEPFKM